MAKNDVKQTLQRSSKAEIVAILMKIRVFLMLVETGSLFFPFCDIVCGHVMSHGHAKQTHLHLRNK